MVRVSRPRFSAGIGVLARGGTVRRLGGRLAKVEEEARLGGLVVVVPRMSVAQRPLLVHRTTSWRKRRGFVGVVWTLPLLLFLAFRWLSRLVQDVGKLQRVCSAF